MGSVGVVSSEGVCGITASWTHLRVWRGRTKPQVGEVSFEHVITTGETSQNGIVS